MLTRNSRATSGDVLRRRHAIDALEGTAEARRFVEAALLCHIVDRQLGRGQQSHGFLHLNGRDERLGRFTGDLLQTTPQGSGRHVYNRMELGYLTPEYSNITDREVTSSGIEDGMIYTTVKATLDDGKQIDILYIVNPETLDFVAASIEDGDITTNYQFSYDNIESLTYEDLEGIAEMNFPTSSTYTVVDLATEETTNKENLYHEDTPHNLVNITPDFAPIKEQTLLSSAIEDGMIYTNFDVTFDNDTTGNVLYINDPETLNFVAATVENEGMSVNYQFAY